MDESRLALGKRVQLLRRRLGLTQEQLAEKAGLSHKHLGELERGRGNPTLSSLESLAGALGISMAEMFDYGAERLPIEQVKAQLGEMIASAGEKDCRLFYRVLRSIMK